MTGGFRQIPIDGLVGRDDLIDERRQRDGIGDQIFGSLQGPRDVMHRQEPDGSRGQGVRDHVVSGVGEPGDVEQQEARARDGHDGGRHVNRRPSIGIVGSRLMQEDGDGSPPENCGRETEDDGHPSVTIRDVFVDAQVDGGVVEFVLRILHRWRKSLRLPIRRKKRGVVRRDGTSFIYDKLSEGKTRASMTSSTELYVVLSGTLTSG